MTDDPASSRGPEPWIGRSVTSLRDRLVRRTPEQLAQAFREGRCPLDYVFDQYLPEDLQALSCMYWTPLSVVQRAAQWLSEIGAGTVVDIGSGAGKFCVAAALSGRCSFIGLEHRPRLVAAARDLAALFEVEDRVRFIEGALGSTDVPAADAYYLYNPFGENLFDSGEAIDIDVELSVPRYQIDVAIVEDLLRRAPVATVLLTYNGFGGRVPRGYREIGVDRELPNLLRMWQKTEPSP